MRRFERRSAVRTDGALDGIEPIDGISEIDRVDATASCDDGSTLASILADVDAALSSTVGRELVSGSDVVATIELLRAVPVAASYAATVQLALDGLDAWRDGRRIVAGAELADRLLDVRLALMTALGTPVRSTALTVAR